MIGLWAYNCLPQFVILSYGSELFLSEAIAVADDLI